MTELVEPTPPERTSRLRELAGALIVYVGLAVIFTMSAWADPTHRFVGNCCDQPQSIWFLAWMPTALELGQNPLLTDRLNAPDGANLMWNTFSPLVGFVFAPVTRLGGPVLAYNVAVLAAIALSGLTCFAALRRYTKGAFGPLVGGAVYAFSPYMASHTALHLDLINAWAPPLFLILIDALVVRRQRRPWVLGAALGVVGALQLLTFEEVLATSALAGALLIAVLAFVAWDRTEIATATRRLVTAILPGLAAFVLIGGLPLAVQFLGPLRLRGGVHDTTTFSTDLLNVILPTPYQYFAPEFATDLSKHFSGLFHEATAYVGIPLLLVLAWVVLARRRDRRVEVAAIMAVLLLVFSLGPELHLTAESTRVPMPWQPIGSLPLIDAVLPGRLTMYMWLAIAGLVAIGIDHAAAMDRRQAVLRIALIGCALVPILPAPARSASIEVPDFFRTWQQQGIAADQVVLFAPWFENGAGADPMLWAAVAEARPRMYEGYVNVPDEQGRRRTGPPPGPLARLMMDVQDHGVLPTLDAEDRAAAFGELADADVSIVIVGPMRYRAEMVTFLTDLFGRPPLETGGVQVWRDLPH